MLEYSIPSLTGSTVTVALRGTMTGQEWGERLTTFLDEQFVADGVLLIALDLGEVASIDLDGIGALVALAKRAEGRGKRLVVLSAPPNVERRLEKTGMLEYLTSGHHRRPADTPTDPER